MSDYIDRDLLLAEIEELKKSPWYNDCGENYERIVRSDAIGTVVDLCVKSAPVADVAEVRHGRKITHKRHRGFYSIECPICEGKFPSNKPYTEEIEYCSECGKRLDDTFQNFCPHCGAKMDGGNNNG